MRLIISREDTRKGGSIVHSIPNLNVPQEVQDEVQNIHKMHMDISPGEKTIMYSFGPYSAGLFEVPSSWYPDQMEKLMVTLYVQDHENPHLFRGIIEETIQRLKQIPNLNKAIYASTPHADGESFKRNGQMLRVLTDGFFEAAKKHETYNLGLAEILVLGNKGGGKSTLIDHLIHGRFVPQKNPTLTPKVMKLVYKNFDFRVLDVCCTTHVKEVLDDHPLEPGKLPQAIVYVIDATLKGKERDGAIREFQDWMIYLSRKYPAHRFSNVPLLILFNKIDIVEDFDMGEQMELFNTVPYGISAKYDGISAKESFGIEENFEWLAKQISVSVKY